jgi:D-sedoheptulose 7-phosphate isomerase
MQVLTTPTIDDVESAINRHILDVTDLLRNVAPCTVARAVELIHATRRAGGVVYACGNGGSAATAMHLCNDLLANGALHSMPLQVHCLTANISTFSALANDTGYENVFVGQLRSLGPDDTVIAISASGNSENCVRAVERARAVGAASIGLVGFEGGRLLMGCQLAIHIPRHDYLAVEDVHAVLCHAIARGLRQGAEG